MIALCSSFVMKGASLTKTYCISTRGRLLKRQKTVFLTLIRLGILRVVFLGIGGVNLTTPSYPKKIFYMLTTLVSLLQGHVKKSEELTKVAKIDGENLHIF